MKIELKKSVIHLETMTDENSYRERIKIWRDSIQKLRDNEITNEEFEELNSFETRGIRDQGSALFCIYKGSYFLVTARHVIFNSREALEEYHEAVDNSTNEEASERMHTLKRARERAEIIIHNMICRVKSLDEAQNEPDTIPRFLMNLGAGTYNHCPYTFSEPENDLAVLSLRPPYSEYKFAEELLRLGYTPFDIENSINSAINEGDDIFAIGYPGATSVIEKLELNNAALQWASDDYSLPVFAFGKISMCHPSLTYFWADISIYPGNSGGPVFSNDKLIGIVSAQASISIEDDIDETTTHYSARIPFGKMMKAELIISLLDQQIKKDKEYSRVSY